MRTSLLLWWTVSSIVVVGCDGKPDDFDCQAREFALKFAKKLLSFHHWKDISTHIRHVREALRLDMDCPTYDTFPRKVIHQNEAPLLQQRQRRTTVLEKQKPRATKSERIKIFVDPKMGDDYANNGTMQHPLRTLHFARDVARSRTADTTIILREGRYYLNETLELDDRDNGLTIQAHETETVILSGGDRLPLTFRPHSAKIYSANLTEQLPETMLPLEFTLLFKVTNQDDERLVWAREPNGHPERLLQPEGYAKAAGRGTARQWPDHGPGLHVAVTKPSRNSTFYPVFGEDFDPRRGTGNWFHVGGPAVRFVNQCGFWNGSVPMGLRYNETTLDASRWTRRGYKFAIAHVFHNDLWGNWQFPIRSVNASQRQIDFHEGGWQEGRGGGMKRQPFFVEGVKEALDVPGEWWLDRDDQILYYYPHGNETRTDTGDLMVELVAPRLKRIVAVTGESETNPALHITFRGMTFAHSATTFMDPYEVPSPGDWSIRRDGALFVENAESLVVDRCRFVRTGGNAIFLSGHVKRASITRTEFAWTGDSGIASAGSLEMADGFTVDSFPENTTIAHNIFREIGIHGKQTSALFSALSCRTSFVGNVAYNGPRAGINLNDQFCHGHRIEGNLLFNWVRETQDHGPINTWNRAMYIQRHPVTGEPTVTPQWTHVSRNFIMNGPSGNRDLGNLFPTIDNDDGSSYFLIEDNFLVYGGTKNFLGHDKIWANNLLAYPGHWSGDPCAMLWAGKNHRFEGNTCIVGSKGDILGLDGNTEGFDCTIDWDDPRNVELVGRTTNNTYYIQGVENWGLWCGNGTETDHFFTLDEMQAHGWEIGSSVRDERTLSSDLIFAMAREKLKLALMP